MSLSLVVLWFDGDGPLRFQHRLKMGTGSGLNH
jgi:hypothetical protein